MTDLQIISNIKSKVDRSVNKALSYWEKKYVKRIVSGLKLRGAGDQEAREVFFEALNDFYNNINYLETYHYSAKLSTYFFRIVINKWNYRIRERKKVHLIESGILDSRLEELRVMVMEDDDSGIVINSTSVTSFMFKALSLQQLKEIVQYSKEVIGEKCYKILRYKYSKQRKYSYEEIMKLVPGYSNANTLKAMANKCRNNARAGLARFYQQKISQHEK